MKLDKNLSDILNENYRDLSPFQILENSIKTDFKNKMVYVCSFGTESAIILHMISRIDKSLPVLLLNTNFLFEETIIYKNYLLKKLDLKNFKEIYPDKNDLKVNDSKNSLWKSDPDSCCNIRKVLPLKKDLENYSAWVSGRKAYHEGERKKIKSFEILDEKIVINPLANVEKDFVNSYFENNKIDRHPLFEKGYLSIGCIHCTEKTFNSADPRSGRWSNTLKTECGIHYSNYNKNNAKKP